ncbi:MAG: transglycosylase SLT domain-containing protein [Thiobacillus sp.]|nr:transglycosylase SLT domain-containing protein [Thiobacillus sp.]
MKHWLTASLLSLALTWASQPLRAEEVHTPALKISYAMAGAPIPGQGNVQDLWDRIRAGFQLPESSPGLIRTHEQWFANHPGHLERAAERSRPYLYHIVDEVQKRGMPMEIALLPMIESAFNPMAQSPQKASGIWQFIPSTGKVFGLRQNGWYDGRRDVVEATQAALDYLEKLHGMFGDWELALAAYNCGEGCVQRAMTRSGGKNFASLRLPTETRHYVPKLVAVRNIVLDPVNYGIQLDPMANEPYFMPVNLKRPIEARTAARLAEMSVDEFAALNPGFQRRVIHTDTRGVLLLPADRVETFQFNLHRQGLDKGTLQPYAALKGESVARIAQKFNVTVEWLKEHNPIKPARGKLTKTQELVVPKVAISKTPPKARVSAKAGKQPIALRKHTVRKGETLGKLARLYDVEVADIQRLNDLDERISPGMELDIPASAAG